MEINQTSLINKIAAQTGLPLKEVEDAIAEAQGDGDRLSMILEEKVRKHPELMTKTSVSFWSCIGSNLSQVIGSTLFFALIMFAIITIIGTGVKGVSLGSVLKTMPVCLIFGLIYSLLRAFSKK